MAVLVPGDRKQAKQRREAAETYQKQFRSDLAVKLRAASYGDRGPILDEVAALFEREPELLSRRS